METLLGALAIYMTWQWLTQDSEEEAASTKETDKKIEVMTKYLDHVERVESIGEKGQELKESVVALHVAQAGKDAYDLAIANGHTPAVAHEDARVARIATAAKLRGHC